MRTQDVELGKPRSAAHYGSWATPTGGGSGKPGQRGTTPSLLTNNTARKHVRLKAGPFILVAEDNSNDEHLLQWAFTQAGVKGPVYFVHNGAEAMDYLLGIPPFDDRTTHPFPRLLLLDLKMPHVDGFELLSWVRKVPSLNQLQIVVMSGSSWQEDFERAHHLGANAYLNKSLDFSELVKAIRDLVAEAARVPLPQCPQTMAQQGILLRK